MPSSLVAKPKQKKKKKNGGWGGGFQVSIQIHNVYEESSHIQTLRIIMKWKQEINTTQFNFSEQSCYFFERGSQELKTQPSCPSKPGKTFLSWPDASFPIWAPPQDFHSTQVPPCPAPPRGAAQIRGKKGNFFLNKEKSWMGWVKLHQKT